MEAMELVLNIYKKKKEIERILSLTTALILLISVFSLPGCGLLRPSVSTNSINITELEKNRRLWQESKIVDYDFVGTKFAGGLYPFVPVLLQVRNGKAISMNPIREKAQLERIDGYEEVDTVEKIFDKIQKAYENEEKVKVKYNQQFGYPEKTTIFPKKGGVDSLDSVEISKFEIIKLN